MLFLVNLMVSFLVFSSLWYCLVSEVCGLVRMCLKLFGLRVLSFMWIGRWFCSLGIRLFGLFRWKVLEVMNRMWLVLIMFSLVFIV